MFDRIAAMALVLTLTANTAFAQNTAPPADPPDQTDPNGLPSTFEKRNPEPATTLAPVVRQAPSVEAPPPHDAYVNVGHVKSGYGWCKAIDISNKTAYYSSVFPGNPTQDSHPRDAAFHTYLKSLYPDIYVLSQDITCIWQQFDADYIQQDQEKEDAYSRVLQNFAIRMTPWRP